MKLKFPSLLAILISSVPAAAQGIDQATLKTGEALLQHNCSKCHAVGQTGTSTHEKAPPFREVMGRYPAENLAEALAEGIVSGHPDMPEFTFTAGEINAIVGYLESLKPVQKP